MTIEIVDFPIENGGSFHSYVSLPEGTVPTTDVSVGLNQLSIAFLTHIWEKESCIVKPVEPVYVWPNGFQC